MNFKPVKMLLILGSLFVSHICIAQDANLDYLKKIAKATRVATPEEVQAVVTKYKAPTTENERVAYEAGMVADLCTRSDEGFSTELLIGCFQDALANTQSPALKDEVAKRNCDKLSPRKKVKDCYSDAYMFVHDEYLVISTQDAAKKSALANSAQSCESRLATAEQKLEALDARISHSDKAKAQIEQIIDAIKTGTPQPSVKAQ